MSRSKLFFKSCYGRILPNRQHHSLSLCTSRVRLTCWVEILNSTPISYPKNLKLHFITCNSVKLSLWPIPSSTHFYYCFSSNKNTISLCPMFICCMLISRVIIWYDFGRASNIHDCWLLIPWELLIATDCTIGATDCTIADSLGATEDLLQRPKKQMSTLFRRMVVSS